MEQLSTMDVHVEFQKKKDDLDTFCQSLHNELSETMIECWRRVQEVEKVERKIKPYRDMSIDILAQENIKNILETQSITLQTFKVKSWRTTCPYTKWIFELSW